MLFLLGYAIVAFATYLWLEGDRPDHYSDPKYDKVSKIAGVMWPVSFIIIAWSYIEGIFNGRK